MMEITETGPVFTDPDTMSLEEKVDEILGMARQVAVVIHQINSNPMLKSMIGL